MKKFLSVVALVVCSFAHAEYTAENKIIKVVIPQSASSGISSIYNHIEAFAKKQNINMIPVFKPGANGKIGINYASEQKNDGNTILFSTISDFVESANDANFSKIAPVSKTSLVLVASNKSKIKSVNDIVKQERTNPGKLNWAYVSSAQHVLINELITANDLDLNKVYKVPYSAGPGLQSSITNGDVDLGFVLPGTAEALSIKGYATVVDIDEKTKQELSKKENGTALFLPKNATPDTIKFWIRFAKELNNDTEFKQVLKNFGIDNYKNTNPTELEKVIAYWKM